MVNQRRLYELIHQGKSFSGHERNCSFLNLGGGAFANTSAISGFDFDDDGRAIGLLDWDRDGDLDCVVSNRTGPRLRMMMNEGADHIPDGERNFLALRLEGTESNRDGIGSRILVYLAGKDVPLMRSVYAGSGYLAQSSRWIHFGLGAQTKIEKVEVRWPHGKVQTLSTLQPNQRYVIREFGEAKPKSVPSERATVPLLEPMAAAGTETSTNSLRVALVVPLPLPSLRWEGGDENPGMSESIQADAEGPLLLNLWSMRCRPCLEELKAWGILARSKKLSKLRIVGLNVDVVAPDAQDSDRVDAVATYARLEAPGELGFATSELLDQMQILCDLLLARQKSLPIPTSFLFGQNGDLLAIYQGKIQDEDLIRDLDLDGDPDVANPKAQLFSGRWLIEPRLDAMLCVSKFIEKDYVEAAEDFFRRHDARVVKSDRYAIVKAQLGAKYVQAKRYEEAEQQFRESLKIKPDNGIALNDLAGVLKKNGELEDAETLFREAVRFEPANPIIRMNLGATLFARGNLDAGIAELELAIQLDPDAFPAHQLLADTYRRLNRLPEAISHLEAMGRLRPDSPEIWMNLGAMLLSMKDVEKGADCLARAAALNPNHAGIQKNLGLAYLMKKDLVRAQGYFEASLAIEPKDAAVHYNLGVLLIELKKTPEALEHLREAMRLRPEDVKFRAALRAAEAIK